MSRRRRDLAEFTSAKSGDRVRGQESRPEIHVGQREDGTRQSSPLPSPSLLLSLSVRGGSRRVWLSSSSRCSCLDHSSPEISAAHKHAQISSISGLYFPRCPERNKRRPFSFLFIYQRHIIATALRDNRIIQSYEIQRHRSSQSCRK